MIFKRVVEARIDGHAAGIVGDSGGARAIGGALDCGLTPATEGLEHFGREHLEMVSAHGLLVAQVRERGDEPVPETEQEIQAVRAALARLAGAARASL